MCDNPRPITTYAEVRSGVRLKADDGFTCLKTGEVVIVQVDETNDFYVDCRQDRHYLDGQCDDLRDGYEGFELVR